MIETLARYIAKGVSEFIEKGSLRFATYGAFIGVLTAWTAAYLLWITDHIVHWIEAGFVFSLFAGIAGAMIGSRLPDDSADLEFLEGRINVWNLNRALAPVVFLAGTCVVVVMALWDQAQSREPSVPAVWSCVICAVVVCAAALVVCLMNYGIQVGQEIRVFRLPRSRIYQRSQIRRWGFEISRGQLITDPAKVRAPLVIEFEDGFKISCEVSAKTAKLVAALMNQN